MSSRKPQVGDVIQLTLPGGRYAYGRVLRDANVAFYSETTAEPALPPTGSRDYHFVVGVYDNALTSEGVSIVGHDSSQAPEDDRPPPNSIGGFALGQQRMAPRLDPQPQSVPQAPSAR